MKIIELSEKAASEAFDEIAGASVELSTILDESGRYGDARAVKWVVPVTSGTVHRIEGLCLLAEEAGYGLKFDVSPDLTERERAFFDDILGARADMVTSKLARLNAQINAQLHEYLSFAGECLRFSVRMGFAAMSRRPVQAAPFRNIALVGVYGFEHVGDMGILGGVLLRIHQRFGVKEAQLFSYRPDYTRRLAAGLDTPVSLQVHSIEPALAKRILRNADAVVWAGGPLMDLPRVLIRNLSAVYLMKRLGRPFLLEGIGVGPFRRSLSRWAARRIVSSAQHISVRTQGAAADPVLDGVNVDIGRDPAFDYLETRRRELSRLNPREAESVQALLRGTDDRLCIGLNIRKIRHFYRQQSPSDCASMERRFMDQLADGLTRFAHESSRPVSYIFFPMNLIQVGMSDLGAAFSLRRHLGSKVDLRIWQADPDVDDVVFLLRRLHMAVTMRFHASIFALSQDLPTIGIDYQAGGKVENLFQDLGRPQDVCRMESLDASWLYNTTVRGDIVNVGHDRILAGEVVLLRGAMQRHGVFGGMLSASLAGVTRVVGSDVADRIEKAGIEHIHDLVPANRLPGLTDAVYDEITRIAPGMLSELVPSIFRDARNLYFERCPNVRFLIPHEITVKNRHDYAEFIRARGEGKITPHGPHRDSWLDCPANSINLWIAIGPVRSGNGLSIYESVYGREFAFQPNGELRHGENPGPASNYDMDPGDILIFHGDHVHGSELNRTDETRHVVSFRITMGRPTFPRDHHHNYVSDRMSRGPFKALAEIPAQLQWSRLRYVASRVVDKLTGGMLARAARDKADPKSGIETAGDNTSFVADRDLPRGRLLALSSKVCVARMQDGRVLAFARRCPHEGGDLADGSIRDGQILCPWHNLAFDPVTGATSCSAFRNLRTYAIEREGEGWRLSAATGEGAS